MTPKEYDKVKAFCVRCQKILTEENLSVHMACNSPANPVIFKDEADSYWVRIKRDVFKI